MAKAKLFTIAMLLVGTLCEAQYYELPFTIDRNKIILPVSINGHREIRLILDSGMPWEGVYLFHSEFLEEFGLTGNMQVQVGGAGSGNASTARQVNDLNLQVGEVVFEGQSGVISMSDHTQDFPTDGVIGWTIFSHPVVMVDYDHHMIRLYDTLPELDDSWKSIDINLNERHIPFLSLKTAVNPNDSLQRMLFYLDLAASEELEMLVREEMKYTLPELSKEGHLGTGLSGSFSGKRGQVARIEITGFRLENCSATFIDAASRSSQGGYADGIIGGGLMKYFNTIYNYPNKKIYIQPSVHMQNRDSLTK